MVRALHLDRWVQENTEYFQCMSTCVCWEQGAAEQVSHGIKSGTDRTQVAGSHSEVLCQDRRGEGVKCLTSDEWSEVQTPSMPENSQYWGPPLLTPWCPEVSWN
jgi:hypothetical protein